MVKLIMPHGHTGDSNMSFAPAHPVGRYEFLGIIDKPQSGITYKVRNLATCQLEALRALPGASAGDPKSVERFLREIRIHTRLAHPNIVTFHDALQLDGQLVMTSEFVEGETLAERFRRGRIPAKEAIRQICDVLSGLEEAHSLGIVHRGITPDNIVVTPDGTVKLGGFGLAKPISDMNLTVAGSVLGNPRYISPEQVSGTSVVDSRADLYSVGVLLYQALTGKAPFDGGNDYTIMVAQVTAQAAAPRTYCPEISEELERIIITGMAKDPSKRFQSAREFREALQNCYGALPQAEARVAAGTCDTVSQTPADPGAGRRSWRAILSGVVSVVIGWRSRWPFKSGKS
jgi:serine/threonine-protein kinase